MILYSHRDPSNGARVTQYEIRSSANALHKIH